MAELLTYDPSNDPQAIQIAEERDAETLAIGQAMEDSQNQLLAGKYKTAQDLEQAYIELQKKLGSPEEQAEQPEEVEEESDPIVAAFEAADDEFDENGELSPETLQKLSAMSSEDLIKAYLAYQSRDTAEAPTAVELSDQDVAEIHNSVGGAEQYQQLVQWAADNFSEQEVEAFDNVVESGNKAAINFAIQALKSRYTDAVGFEGTTLQGKAATSQDVFRSQAELVAAMNDPRYDRDPAYRQDIYNKLDRSNLSF